MALGSGSGSVIGHLGNEPTCGFLTHLLLIGFVVGLSLWLQEEEAN